jgi:ubiquinone/menaquinone biosynthesis C-methylase UbiE
MKAKRRKRYVEKFVGITSEEYEELGDRHRKVLEIFFEHRFDRILDVGCGDGRFTVLIGKACKAKEVYGVDISEKGVEMARKNGVKAFIVDVDEENLPFENNYFDAIYAGAIIEHLFDQTIF